LTRLAQADAVKTADPVDEIRASESQTLSDVERAGGSESGLGRVSQLSHFWFWDTFGTVRDALGTPKQKLAADYADMTDQTAPKGK